MAMTVQQAPAAYGVSMIGTSSRSSKMGSSFHIPMRMEYVADIQGSTSAFTLQYSLPVNPGLSASFPWLSKIANNYDMYKFRKLRIYYITKTQSGNTGEITIVFDPKSTDSPPASDTEALQYNTKISTFPWVASACVDVPYDVLGRLPRFLVRDGVVSADVSEFDVGVIHVITGGNLAGRAGQLWLEYEIELMEPQIKGTATTPPRSTSQFVLSTNTALTTGVLTRIPFDTVSFNPLGITIASGLITGLSGSFLVYAQQTISAASMTAGALVIRKNGTGLVNAQYPPLLNGFSTLNVEVVVQLSPSDQLDVAVNIAGGTLAAAGTPNSVLVINPA